MMLKKRDSITLNQNPTQTSEVEINIYRNVIANQQDPLFDNSSREVPDQAR
jgi:hypothetical protein